MTFAEGHKFSGKRDLLGSFFSHSFELMRMKFGEVMKQFKLYFMVLMVKITIIKGNKCCFPVCFKN